MVAALEPLLTDYLASLKAGTVQPLPSAGQLWELPAVRIFAAGVYDVGTPEQTDYTTADLADVVRNFQRFSTGAKPMHIPPLVIGHEERQDLLDQSNLPAAGWIRRIWTVGPILYAQIRDVPDEAARWIQSGQYRYVSAEFYDDPTQAGIQPDQAVGARGLLLRRVALLGGTPPKVKTLGPVPPPQRQFASRIARLRTLQPTRRTTGPKLIRCFAEVTMDRKALEQIALGKGFSRAFLDLLSDDQLQAMCNDLAAQATVQTPPAASTNADPMTPAAGRDQMIAALVALGQDPDALASLSDQDLAALYQQMSATAPAPMQNADGTTPPPAMAPATPAASPSMPPGAPSQVILKYCEALIKVRVARALAEQAGQDAKSRIKQFCDEQVKAGRLTPAQVEPGKGIVALALEKASAVKKFGEQESDLDRLMNLIRQTAPAGRKFSEQMPSAKPGQGDERRRRLLAATPEGREILRNEAKAQTK